jgi:hypothetical protein
MLKGERVSNWGSGAKAPGAGEGLETLCAEQGFPVTTCLQGVLMTDFHAGAKPKPPRITPPPKPPVLPRPFPPPKSAAARMTRGDVETLIRKQRFDSVNADAIRSLFPGLYHAR